MKKKIFIIFLLLFIFFIWIWKDFKKIDLSYINQSKITYNYNNINSPALRKFYNFYHKVIEKEINYQNLRF